MSFINREAGIGQAYAPGWFLANNEDCTRETRQVAQNSALVVTDGNNGKHVPMGTAYPTNDGNAIGIVYEDVDVTNGDMPGSVVTQGVVYEDRLAITGADYDAATIGNFVSPKDEGWYERSGSSPDYTYTLSTDTTASGSKTYYAKSGDEYSAVTVGNFVSPAAQGWYERSGSSPNYVYTASTDTTADGSKTYYIKSDVRLASAAKTALAALGIKFIASAPSVTRPY